MKHASFNQFTPSEFAYLLLKLVCRKAMPVHTLLAPVYYSFGTKLGLYFFEGEAPAKGASFALFAFEDDGSALG